jgi:adenylate cyclase
VSAMCSKAACSRVATGCASNAQLIDTESDVHLWADQFDEGRSDLLQVQDDIVHRIARAIDLKVPVEMARLSQTRAANPNVEDLAWRCYGTFVRTFWTSESDAAFRLCEQALQIDLENVRALSILTLKFTHRVLTYAGPDRPADLRRADELASLAIKIDPDFYLAQMAKSNVLLAQGRHQEAIDAYRRALILNPSGITPGLPMAYDFLGEPEHAIAYVDKAMRLSPHDPFSAPLYWAKALAYAILQDYQEALVWTRRSEAGNPDSPNNGLWRSGLLALAGQEADARATMQQYLANPKAPVRTITQWQSVLLPTNSPRYLSYRQKLIEGLRKAGLPE